MFDLVNIFSRKSGRNNAAKAALLPLILSVAACSTNSYPPVSDAQKSAGADYSYVVGPGDTMEIFVWGNEELTTVGVVRLAEDMQASGKTSTELARDIEKAYAEYVKQPVVSVIINEFVGVPSQQVRVVGEAIAPTSVPYRKHMTLLDLMIAVGGMTEFAAGNSSVLVRIENGMQQSYALRLDDLIKEGDISADLALMPGDIIIISESWF
jgi:polysaccharide export outer membrane protein